MATNNHKRQHNKSIGITDREVMAASVALEDIIGESHDTCGTMVLVGHVTLGQNETGNDNNSTTAPCAEEGDMPCVITCHLYIADANACLCWNPQTHSKFRSLNRQTITTQITK